jgi:hypothetical protein
MPRVGTLPADIADYLRHERDGASIADIAEALKAVRRSDVLPHSVRSAIYQHLDAAGEGLFVKLARGRYGLRR